MLCLWVRGRAQHNTTERRKQTRRFDDLSFDLAVEKERTAAVGEQRKKRKEVSLKYNVLISSTIS